MSTIIDGRLTANTIREEVAEQVAALKSEGLIPHLTVILVGADPASQVYVRNKQRACEKAGISSETIRLTADISEESLIDEVKKHNSNPSVHGILVQLPLPKHIREQKIIETIDPGKDVDGFHPVNTGLLTAGLSGGFVPCTPAGIQQLLYRYGFDPEGKHVVVVGRSNIVGKPIGMLLIQKKAGANATVTLCHSRTPNLPEMTRSADILIAAIGRPEMIKADMVKPGAVVIDVGMNRVDDPSREKGYRLCGDVDFEGVSQVAGAITPVPGGVGPMTIAMLMVNTVQAAISQTAQRPPHQTSK